MNETALEVGVSDLAGIPGSLDAAAPVSASERRARLTHAVLEGVVHRILDDAEAAATLGDMAELLAQMGDHRSALSIAREAFRRHPKAAAMARVYRKMATRTGRKTELLQALEGESRLATHPSYRAALEFERGRLLEKMAQPGPAQAAYEVALVGHRVEVAALIALERLAAQRAAPARAAELAQRLAETVIDPDLRSEHRARAARWHLRADDVEAARTQAALAVHAGHVPAARAIWFEVAATPADLVELRLAELADGTVALAAGWFDVGVLAGYFVGDARQAIDAFETAASHATGLSRAAALAELASILSRQGEWKRLLEVERARLELETSPERQVVLLTQIATLLEDRLGDDEAAASAYELALEKDPGYRPALEGAGRAFQRVASRDRLLRMHELEAKSAESPSDRAHALRRLGELLLEDPARRDEGIAAVRAALAEAPGDPMIVAALARAFTQAGAWADLLVLHDQQLANATQPAQRGWLLLEIGTIAADRLGDRGRAITAFREAATIGSVGPHYVLTRLAQMLEETGDLIGVAETLERLAEGATEPTHRASILERVARAHEQRGDTAAALETYARALEIAPPYHSVTAAAGRAFFRARRYAEMAALFDRLAAATEGADRARFLYKAADVAARHLDRDVAVVSLEASLDLMPDFLPARVALLAILIEQGRWGEAQERLAREPEPEMLRLRRAVLAEASGDVDLAIGLYADAVKAGITIAAAGYERLLTRARRWRELADHYLSGRAAINEQHSRFRAAQILVDHLEDPAAAVNALEAALVDAPGDVALLAALRPHIAHQAERFRTILARLADRTSDPATRHAYQLELTHVLEEAGMVTEALIVRERLVNEQRDPVVDVAVELAFEARGDDERLVAHLRKVANDPTADVSVVAWAQAGAARRLLDLGRPGDALDACDAAAEKGLRSIALLVTTCHAARAVGDITRRRQALTALADALPGGEERAAALVQLARDLESDGGDAAIAQYRAALRAHPLDTAALLALDRLLSGHGDASAMIEPLTRAFNADDDRGRRTSLGLALAGRLLDANRLSGISEILERVAASEPDTHDDLRRLVIAAELQDRQEAWGELVLTYQAIIDHPDTSAALSFQALWRLISVRAVRLGDPAGARVSAALLRGVEHDDSSAWALHLRVLELVDDAPAMADTLRALTRRSDVPDGERARLALRLAEIEEEKLGDPGAAIETLSGVQSPACRHEVAQRLLEIGEKTGRWAAAAAALEKALDRGGAHDASWEVAIRTRLASLLEGPLGRPDAAVRQYESVVVLDPGNIGALQRLTTLCADSAPAAAVEHHRALLGRTPAWIPSYHSLRTLLLALDDEDGAFCAEAVLVGLGEATDEEAYFYRQRRARLPAEATGTVTQEERDILFPDSLRPAFALLRLLTDRLHAVFPVDFDSYGITPDATAGVDHPLTHAAHAAARLLGVAPPRVALISPRLGPTIELGPVPLLLLPRTLEDVGRREQLHTCGELLGRAATGGILGHPRRQGAGGAQIIDYVLWAVCSAVEPAYTSPAHDHAVFRDIRRRADGLCAEIEPAELRRAVDAYLTAAEPISGEAMLAVFTRASLRAGILTAHDPAVAIAALRGRGSDGLVVDRLPTEALAAVAFAVSSKFLALRRRLGMEVNR